MLSPRLRFRLLSLVALTLAVILPSSAQTDPNPNSPEPVLISIEGSPRVFGHWASKAGRYSVSKAPKVVFAPGSRIVIFVGNLSLMEGEGANAFRIQAEDSSGRFYRFPVTDIRPAQGQENIFAITAKLEDESGYWTQLKPDGDLKIHVTWRGLATNKLKLGIGSAGGQFDSDRSMRPYSFSDLAKNSPVGETEALVNQNGFQSSGLFDAGDRIRFLEQSTFGPTPASEHRLRLLGTEKWLRQQFSATYPSPQSPYPEFPLKSTDQDHVTLGCGMFTSGSVERRACDRNHYSMYPVQNWFFQEAFYGDAQLRHRVAWALSQIWVISGNTTQQSSWMTAYHKVLSKNAFGNYRTLMEEMTLNPGMGNFLDMARSTRNNPNENYPRELLQLFTVGLFEMNQDGSLKRDAGNNPIPTYDQERINNFTKVFTGFSLCNTGCPNSASQIDNYKDPMILTNTNNHNLTAKSLFDYPNAPNSTIPACSGCNAAAITTYANNSLDQALDNIFHHPNLGPFVSKLLIQHLVTSDPTPAYIGRVAGVFNDNGLGVRGDMKAIIRAILRDPEARGNLKTDPNFGKLREPVQLLTNLFRQVGVKGAGGVGLSDGVVNGSTSVMSQNTFNSPSVFNYYSPSNIVPGTSLLGPEFGLMTTGTSIARANFANTMVFNQIGVSETTPQGTSLDLVELQSIAAADPSSSRLLDTLNRRMMHGSMSPEMRASIVTSVNSIASTNPLQRARQALYLVTTSSQFQVQR